MRKRNFSRILAFRTDRIGDVLLTTPALRALKGAFPRTYLALVVSPYTRGLVDNNPDLDEVIVYDKTAGWREALRFVRELRGKKFELALIFNPKLRNNLIAFLAHIPVRVSYDNKGGWLANLRIENRKYLGQKHELDCTLDFLELLGVDRRRISRNLVLEVNAESGDYIDNFLRKRGIEPENLVVIHPGATVPSKRWPVERFAEVADDLIQANRKICVIGSTEEKGTSRDMLGLMSAEAVDTTGSLDLQQLAALIKKSRLLISNDAGPVHIASAVRTPAVVIFGRKAGGLGPSSWAPEGSHCRVLHKDVGCEVCLHDHCRKDFACFKAVTPEEVTRAALDLLKET